MRNLILVLMLALAGCTAEPRLDASSEEALKNSIERMTSEMTDQEKEQFGKNIMAVSFFDSFGNMMQKAMNGEEPEGFEMFATLDGLTASQIEEKADEIRNRVNSRGENKTSH